MEKSIEEVWKEGFLKSDVLVAPKLNDLYNQKSKSIIEKFRRMMKVNLIMIFLFSLVVLIWWYFMEVPVIGFLIFLLLNAFALYSKVQMNKMKEIDQAASSYQYLKSFQHFLKTAMSNNVRIMRFFYPIMFLAAAATAWYSKDNETVLTRYFMDHYPDMMVVLGIPVAVLAPVLLIAVVMYLFAGKIYQWDVNIVYGRVFKKLDEILEDMEELRETGRS